MDNDISWSLFRNVAVMMPLLSCKDHSDQYRVERRRHPCPPVLSQYQPYINTSMESNFINVIRLFFSLFFFNDDLHLVPTDLLFLPLFQTYSFGLHDPDF